MTGQKHLENGSILAPGCPIFNQEKQGQNSSNPARIRQAVTEDVKQKNPEKPQFFGVFEHL